MSAEHATSSVSSDAMIAVDDGESAANETAVESDVVEVTVDSAPKANTEAVPREAEEHVEVIRRLWRMASTAKKSKTSSSCFLADGYVVAEPDFAERKDKAVQWSYFLPLAKTPTDAPMSLTHVCVLCAKLYQLGSDSSNARKHLLKKHRGIVATSTDPSAPDCDVVLKRHLFAGDVRHSQRVKAGAIDKMLTATAERELRETRAAAHVRQQELTDTEVGTRMILRGRLSTGRSDITNLIHEKLVRLGTAHHLPFSFVEWKELRELLDVCLLAPPAKYAIRHVDAYKSQVENAWARMRQDLGGQMLYQMLDAGEGSMYMLMDGVATRRGEMVPILLEWIDREYERVSVTLAMAFEPGKSAHELAEAAFDAFKVLDLMSLLRENEAALKGLPAFNHFQAYYKKHTKHLPPGSPEAADDDARVLALYAIGGATTDGAMLNLLAEFLRNRDTNDLNEDAHTTWCISHRISLALRFAFALKEQCSIVPPERSGRVLQSKFNDILEGLVDLYSAEKNFLALTRAAKRLSLRPPVRMSKATDTRFLSYVDLLVAVDKNLALFRSIDAGEADTTPAAIAALFENRAYRVDGTVTVMRFETELRALMPIVSAARDLLLYSESDSVDMHLFSSQLSFFLARVNDTTPFIVTSTSGVAAQVDDGDNDDDQTKTSSLYLRDLIANGPSVLCKYVADNIKYALSFYFDRDLGKDWSALLALVLHPRNSGRQLTSFESTMDGFEPLPVFKNRYTLLWEREAGGRALEQVDARERVAEAMAMMNKIVCEEIRLQLEIDAARTGQRVRASSKRPPPRHIYQHQQRRKRARGAAPVSAEEYMASDDEEASDDGDVDSASGADDSDSDDEDLDEDAADEQTRLIAKPVLDPWLSRRRQPTDGKETLLSFWKREPDSVLRRVVRRIAAFVPTQCSVERANKVPKSIWRETRSSLAPQSVAMESFLSCNPDLWREPAFRWPQTIDQCRPKAGQESPPAPQ